MFRELATEALALQLFERCVFVRALVRLASVESEQVLLAHGKTPIGIEEPPLSVPADSHNRFR